MESSTPHREQDGRTMPVEEALRVGSEAASTLLYEWPETQYRLRNPYTVTIEEVGRMTDDEFKDFQTALCIVNNMRRYITQN